MPARPLPWVLVAVALTFLPALQGQYLYDDLTLLPHIERLLAQDRFADIVTAPFWGEEHPYWRPLSSLLLALGHGIGAALGVHALALLGHLASTSFAFLLARELGLPPRPAAIVALLFGLHPLQVESVAWASALSDVIGGATSLGALWALLRWRHQERPGPPLLALTLFLLSLLAKESGVLLVPLLVAILISPRPRTRAPMRRLLLVASQVLGILLLYLALRVLVFESLAAGIARTQADASYAGARSVLAPFWIAGTQLASLGIPWPLTPFREVPMQLSVLEVLLRALLLGAVALLAWRARRDPRMPVLLAMLLLPIALVAARFDALGPFPAANRYLYLCVFPAAFVFTRICLGHRVLRIGLAVITVVFVALSVRQTAIWKDQQTLVEHGLRQNPKSPRVQVMRGNQILRDVGATEDAEPWFRRALLRSQHIEETRPELPPSRSRTDALVGLGWCAIEDRRPLLALSHFEHALTLDPESAPAWTGRGVAHAMRNDEDAAEKCFLRALEHDAEHVPALFNLGRLAEKRGQLEAARAWFERVLRSEPRHATARRKLQLLH